MEKIDFVITWVDGSDPKWLKEKYKYEKEAKGQNTEDFKNWINAKSRYRDWDCLKYWFRGVEKYAPWVNKIYFITWGHVPDWLDLDNEKLVIVKHEDFIPKEYLPTYNSNAIELNVHRIKELEKHFVLFNDDFFINDYVIPTDFFKKGLPVETAGFDCISTNYKTMNSDINNVKLLNKYFKKKDVLRKNFFKWFNPKNGKCIIKTLFLSPWKNITGIAEMHVACSYIKDNFDLMWKKEYDRLHNTCLCKFRDFTNVNHWLIKGYQLLSGQFYPRSANFGKSYIKKIDDEIINDIVYSRHKMICINDFECSDKEFEEQKEILKNAFETKLSKKSSFERKIKK